MKRLFYLGFGLLLVTSVGCIVTDYPLITDNDQTLNGQGSGVVNTSGKAHIQESSQVATLWPDGNDEYIWFVDQKSNGDRTLSTYNNFSTVSGQPTFHDDAYCNPDWQGCAISTSTVTDNVNFNDYAYNFNANCNGARSASILLATTRYYGECGRAKMPLADRISFINSARIGTSMGLEGLFFDMNHSNLTISLDNQAGFVTTLPINASSSLFASLQGRRGTLDLTNPLWGSVGNSYADFLANHATGQTKITVSFNGISFNRTMAGNVGISNAARWRSNINKSY